MRIKLFLIAAIALMIGFTSCSKESDGQYISDEKMAVSVKMVAPAQEIPRSDEPKADKTTIGVGNGYLCFVAGKTGEGTLITDVYTIGEGATKDKHIKIDDLTGEGGVSLNNVPENSGSAYFFGNLSVETAPAVGMNIKEYMNSPKINVGAYSDYTTVFVNGQGNLESIDENNKKVAIGLATTMSRIQLEELKFSDEFKAITLEGIFMDNYLPLASLDNTFGDNIRTGGDDNELFDKGTGIFPKELNTYVYDVEEFNEFADNKILPKATDLTAEPKVQGVWGYNLFAVDMPKIVLKFSGVEINGELFNGDGKAFITIKGFSKKNGETTSPINELEAGKVYTFAADTFTFTPDHFSPNPNTEAITVNVEVTNAEWNYVNVLPNI